MEEKDELMSVAMKIIMKAGNARTKTNKALDYLAEGEYEKAKELVCLAREDITEAHKFQTSIIQGEAAGVEYKSTMLFTHAQDTLMTIMSEVNITEKLVAIISNIDIKKQ